MYSLIIVTLRYFMVFWAHCKNGKLLKSLECAVDSEWKDIIIYTVLCLVVELFIEITKIQLLTAYYFTKQLCYNSIFGKYKYACVVQTIVVLGALLKCWILCLSIFLQVVEKCQSTFDSACAWSTKDGAWTHAWFVSLLMHSHMYCDTEVINW